VQCGVGQTGRIVGGEDAAQHEFPWMAALQMSWGVQYCGGALVSEKVSNISNHFPLEKSFF
jgi:hypothetical protein